MVTDFRTIGKLQREKIEELETMISAERTAEREHKRAMFAKAFDHLNYEGLFVQFREDGIKLDRANREWGFVDVTINDRWHRDSKSYDVRFSASSFSGYTSNENEDNHADYVKMTVVAGQAIEIMKTLIPEYSALEAKYLEMQNRLYSEKRVYTNELQYLLDKAEHQNEKEILDLLQSEYDLSPIIREGYNAATIYTGYGDNTEFANGLKITKISGKSVLVEGTRGWSDGTKHYNEFRIKKAELIELVLDVERAKKENVKGSETSS